jgi:hypothetical protein
MRPARLLPRRSAGIRSGSKHEDMLRSWPCRPILAETPTRSQGEAPSRTLRGESAPAPINQGRRPVDPRGATPAQGDGVSLANASTRAYSRLDRLSKVAIGTVRRRTVEPMTCPRIAQLALATALALLMPLESAHCAFMGFGKPSPPAHSGAAASHECCESPAAATSDQAAKPDRPDQDPCSSACTCIQLPAGVPAAAIAQIDAPISATSLIVAGRTFTEAPPTITTERVAALDVGSPPLLEDPGAHGLRAPPASA